MAWPLRIVAYSGSGRGARSCCANSLREAVARRVHELGVVSNASARPARRCLRRSPPRSASAACGCPGSRRAGRCPCPCPRARPTRRTCSRADPTGRDRVGVWRLLGADREVERLEWEHPPPEQLLGSRDTLGANAIARMLGLIFQAFMTRCQWYFSIPPGWRENTTPSSLTSGPG